MKENIGPFCISVVTFASITMLLAFVSPALADDLKDELVAIEKAQWQAWKDRNGEAYRDVVTEDAVFIVADGSITEGRDAIIADISGHECQSNSLDFADFKVRQLSPDTAILTYTTTQDTTCEGYKLPSPVYSESVYVRQGGKWRTASYQETALE
jgi:uncharacterized protein (TIGR02246 family)